MDNSEILEERKIVGKAQMIARDYHLDDTTAVMIVLAANIQRLIDATIESDRNRTHEFHVRRERGY